MTRDKPTPAIPPPGFLDGEAITLKMTDAPAREVLCAILAAAPFEAQYEYWNYPPEGRLDMSDGFRSLVQIYFYKTGGGCSAEPGPLDMMREYFWKREAALPRELDEEHRIEQIRAILGRTPEEFAVYDWDTRERFYEVAKWGMYNLPYYIQAVREDNNPIVFRSIQMYLNAESSTIAEGETLSECVQNTVEAYPTREDKLREICRLWHKSHDAYGEYKDLYDAIEAALEGVCEEE